MGLFGLGTFLSRFACTGTLTLVYVGMYSNGRGGVRSWYGSNIACLRCTTVLYGPNARDTMSVDTSIELGSMAASGLEAKWTHYVHQSNVHKYHEDLVHE
jgi:hypothetical protein